MSNPNRVTSGIPTGGQFATTSRGEADIDLTEPTAVAVDDDTATQGACVLTGAAGEDSDDCTTHDHEADGQSGVDDAAAPDEADDEDYGPGYGGPSQAHVRVFDDGNGGHVREDGKRGFTCPACGNGYATHRAMDDHDCVDADDSGPDPDVDPAESDPTQRRAQMRSEQAELQAQATDLRERGMKPSPVPGEQQGYLRSARIADERLRTLKAKHCDELMEMAEAMHYEPKLSFGEQAIRDHFDGNGRAQLRPKSKAVMESFGNDALEDPELREAYGRALDRVADENGLFLDDVPY